jgi:small neutral amino acid transporter SnatA (MarC family)
VNGTGANTIESLSSKGEKGNLSQAKSVYRQIVIPMAMPLLVGPGVIANVILYASEAEKLKVSITLELIPMTTFVSFLLFLVLASGKSLQRILGDIGLNITQRVMGLFVAAIGVQFVVTGLIDIIVYNIAPEVLRIK